MKIQILGCGSSSGTPVLGCKCKICKSPNPKNKRMRQSIFVEHKDTKIIIDSGPDFRRQYLTNDISGLDGILYTHAHQDHVGGFDEAATLALSQSNGLNMYIDQVTLDSLRKRFIYLFEGSLAARYTPKLKINIIKPNQSYKLKGIDFYPFEQGHGYIKSLGFKIENIAYSTDFISLGDQEFELLSNIDLWIIECLRYEPMPTHMHLEKTLSFIDRVKPKKAILIHMSHDVDYDEISAMLPENVHAAYDGMVINL